MSIRRGVVLKTFMEKIEPLADHLLLSRFPPGTKVEFHGKIYNVLIKTTLASGEPALVLQAGREQFVVSASEFLANGRLPKN